MPAVASGKTKTMPDQDFHRMLDRARELSFEFERHNPDGSVTRFLANHLELSLVAMHRLGASAPRMEEFFERYATRKKLHPVAPCAATLSQDNWRQHLGDRA